MNRIWARIFILRHCCFFYIAFIFRLVKYQLPAQWKSLSKCSVCSETVPVRQRLSVGLYWRFETYVGLHISLCWLDFYFSNLSKLTIWLYEAEAIPNNSLFKNSVRTAKKIQCFNIAKISWLMLFKEIIPICTDNHTKFIYTSYWLVK
jgi:hypothetical protein